MLEPRHLLATFVVDTIVDNPDAPNDGLVSLREAIAAANTNEAVGDAAAGDAAGDVIQFAPEIDGQTITLAGSELTITEGLVIRGGEVGVTVDANQGSRIFDINTDQRVFMAGLTLTNGLATEGGAILVQGGGVLQLSAVDFTGNTSNSLDSGGGAIFSFDSTVRIGGGSTFTGNTALGSGGAIYSITGQVNTVDTTFTANRASGAGGAYAANDGRSFFNRTTFTENRVEAFTDVESDDADTIGSSVEVADEQRGGALAISGDDTVASLRDSRLLENYADNGGGAIVFIGGGSLSAFAGTEFSNNTTLGNGGAIQSEGTLRIGQTTFNENFAFGTNLRSGFGGAIFSVTGDIRVSSSTFTGNISGNSGGAISAFAELSVLSTTFRDNSAGVIPEGLGGFNAAANANPSGGAISYGGNNRGFIAKSVFQFNKARGSGGAIANFGDLTVARDTFIGGNSALVNDFENFSGGGGGGIYSRSGLLRLNSVKIQNNQSGFSGGGILLQFDADLRMIDSVVNLNRAATSGGGIELFESTALIIGSSIGETGAGNRAAIGAPSGGVELTEKYGKGGGISLFSASRLLLRDTQVIGNRARIFGGGLWGRQDRFNTVFRDNAVRIVDSVFAENSARVGGGVFARDTMVVAFGSSITENDAVVEAGGLRNINANANLTRTVIENNTAPQSPNVLES